MISQEEVTLAILAGEVKCPAFVHYGYVGGAPCGICRATGILTTDGLSAMLISALLALGRKRELTGDRGDPKDIADAWNGYEKERYGAK